jgi:hypothetical protein
MGTATETEQIGKARKRHRCDWCWEFIVQGQPYRRWRWFDSGDASTVRVHPECDEARIEEHKRDPYFTEWMPGDNPRGCNCGFDRGCPRCAARKAVA